MNTMAKRTVDAKDLRMNLSKYLRRVKSGETIVITEGGEPIGEITPVQLTLEKRIKALVDSGAADWNGKSYRPKRPRVHNDNPIQISDLVVDNRDTLRPASKDIPYN
jgi:prevent-host-death family protein